MINIGISVAISRSNIAKFKMNMFDGVLNDFDLEINIYKNEFVHTLCIN